MVIDDGLIRNMEAGQIRRVLAPKVLGALHLHELTKSLPLDFFVLYSSATTLFGNPGQGNYIAANAALETLARKRRLAGLPATCIRWGAIDDVGYLARNTQIKEAFQGRTGGSALQSSVALETLETMLLTDRSDLAVLDLDWTTLSRFLPSSTSTKFTDLARRGAQVESTADAAVDIARLLAERSDEELVDTFSDMLKEELGVILRVAPEKLDPTRSVYDMGFDSLMGVELIVAMESRFGIRLSIMALSETPTITKLANRIIVELRAAQSVRPPAVAADDVSRRVEQVVSQHDADFSAEEIRRFAEKIKSGETATQQRLIH
jgi:acyl carrier protein